LIASVFIDLMKHRSSAIFAVCGISSLSPGFAGTQKDLDVLLAECLVSNELMEDEFWSLVNAQTDAMLSELKTGSHS